jgi:hypothetical protein
MFLEIRNTVYFPKKLDTSNMELLYEIEAMFNKKFRLQPIWSFDEERKMYYTILMFGAIPFLTSHAEFQSKYRALNKYGFLNKDLKPFNED